MSELSLTVHPSVCPVGTGVAKVIVHVVTRVPVNMMLPAISLPEMLFVEPQEDTTGFTPLVTTSPFLSTEKFGRPLFVVEAKANIGFVAFPTAEIVEYGVEVPTPRNGFDAVVSTLNTFAPAALNIENAFVTFVTVFMRSPPSAVTPFEMAWVNEFAPYTVVVVPTPTVAPAVMKSVEVPTRPPVLAKYAPWPVVPVNSEDVATADGTPEAPVTFPRTELAAIAARPMVPVVVMVPPVIPLLVAIEVTVPDPPEGVVVAIIFPLGSAARKVPAAVPRVDI